MPVMKNREYRNAEAFKAVDNSEEEKKYIVEGYASTYEPYVMMEDENGNKYSERIDPKAFESADMSDVIMQYDHEGRVFARQSNGTLEVNTDDKGLFIRADLSKTELGRQLYEDISAGMINQMSFAFTVDSDHYEKESRTRVIDRVKKIYDVSAVSIPANPDTTISARSYFDGVIEIEHEERMKAEQREKQKQRIRILMELSNGN